MRTSGRDIYVSAGDNFYFTIMIKDQQDNKVDLIEGQDIGKLNIRINHSVKTIDARITGGEFSFYVGSDITSMAPNGGVFHYEVKHIKPDIGAAENQEKDLVTTIIPLSLFVIEESLIANSATNDSEKGKNPEEAI